MVQDTKDTRIGRELFVDSIQGNSQTQKITTSIGRDADSGQENGTDTEINGGYVNREEVVDSSPGTGTDAERAGYKNTQEAIPFVDSSPGN